MAGPHCRISGAFCVLLLLCNGSAADTSTDRVLPKAESAPDTCDLDENDFMGLPEAVVVGTAVRQVTDFRPSHTPYSHYQAETGGAVLELELIRHKGKYTLKRSFEEPGASEQIKEYQAVCIEDGHLSGDDIRGKVTKRGLLVLETSSGVDGISPALWIFYEKKE